MHQQLVPEQQTASAQGHAVGELVEWVLGEAGNTRFDEYTGKLKRVAVKNTEKLEKAKKTKEN